MNTRCLLKNEFYAEENEVRVFIKVDYRRMEKLDFYRESSFKDIVPKYRIYNNKIVPYLAVRIFNPEYHFQAIKSVVLGPNNNSKVEDIENFLKIHGFKDVKVEKSRGEIR